MLLACSLAALALAGSPAGGRHLETTIQDDAVLLSSAPAAVREAARRMAWLGVDRVRITAGWSAVAPAPLSRRRPGPPWDASDPATYPREPFARLDRAVKASHAAGLKTMVDLAFWAPRWAVRRAVRPAERQTWAPDPAEFGRFAAAVARRYDGTVPDPERPGHPLPAVRMWTTWNEPNNPTFLRPQWIRREGAWRPESPHVYRALHNAAYDALMRSSPDNVVLVGGTAATGSRTPGSGGVAPLRFLRELACVDAGLRPLAIPECRDYRPLRAHGYAHHPYSRFATPATSDPDPDAAPLADTARLEGLLADLAARGRLARALPVYQTEFGYETNPPDPKAPFGLQQQAQFTGWSTYLAWRDPGTRMFAQFLLRDIDPLEARRQPGHRRYWNDFQTGLFFADGTPKPAALAFRLPFWAELRAVGGQTVVLLFGGVRPADGRAVVRVERRPAAGGPWVPVSVSGDRCDGREGPTFLTDSAGWFLRAAPYEGPAAYRLARLRQDGSWETGVEVPAQPGLSFGPGARPGEGVATGAAP
jgi:hypothetical protein